MSSIGNWWVSSHQSRTEETVVGSYYVNFLRPEQRPLGGKLYLTTQRLLFSPHLIDSLFGGETFEIDLGDVESVRRLEAEAKNDSERGKPERLAIERSGRPVVEFVISDMQRALDDVREELERDDSRRPE